MTYKVKDFIDAIPGSGGIITTIAKRVGCTWLTAQTWIAEKPTVRQAYEDEKESMLDRAEGVIHAGIEAGDSQDAKWFLSKKGKDRGYGDMKDIHVTGEQLINVTFDEWVDDNEGNEDKLTTEEGSSPEPMGDIQESEEV